MTERHATVRVQAVGHPESTAVLSLPVDLPAREVARRALRQLGLRQVDARWWIDGRSPPPDAPLRGYVRAETTAWLLVPRPHAEPLPLLGPVPPTDPRVVAAAAVAASAGAILAPSGWSFAIAGLALGGVCGRLATAAGAAIVAAACAASHELRAAGPAAGAVLLGHLLATASATTR